MTWQAVSVACVLLVAAGCIAEGEATDVQGSDDQPDPRDLPPVSENEARITGTLTDDSLAPIAGAQVGILNSDPQVVVTTNEAGQFALVGLVPGPYTIQFQQLGYLTVTKQVDAVGGQTVDIQVILNPIAVQTGESRYFTIIGEGYFACGADTPVVTWGNLHACVYDTHKPNVSFEAPKADLTGIMDEVVWTQSSGLTSQSLYVYLAYGQVCDPFCENAATFDPDYGDDASPSPVRFYVSFDDKQKERVPEDPMPLKSITFPNRDGEPFVIVFQQRMTHYITLFWGPLAEETVLEDFSAIPDA